MVKLYYRKSDGFLCHRFPTDIETEDDFIEVEDDLAKETYVVGYAKHWAVIDGELKVVDDAEFMKSPEYLEHVKQNEITDLEAYLASTDYVISKLNELKIEDEAEYEKARVEYEETLQKRKAARARVNELS